jgi:ATP/maltotriose-dependent transcriptional regulator MalT
VQDFPVGCRLVCQSPKPHESRQAENAPPDPILIRTKFSRPPSRPEFVERPRLLDRLDQPIEQHRIILVSAPPGFGKTTLVTQRLARQRVPAAWLALDNSDSDPERIVRYLIAAIEDGTLHRCQNPLRCTPRPRHSLRLCV